MLILESGGKKEPATLPLKPKQLGVTVLTQALVVFEQEAAKYGLWIVCVNKDPKEVSQGS